MRTSRHRGLRHACALVAACASVLAKGNLPAHAETTACRQGISRDTTERLFAVLNHPLQETDCKFEGVETNRSQLAARWSHGGTLLPPVSVVPRECAPDAASHVGSFVIDVPREVAENCPSAVPLLAVFEQQVGNERPAGEVGSLHDPLYRGTRALLVGIMLVAVCLLGRGAAHFCAPRYAAKNGRLLGVNGLRGDSKADVRSSRVGAVFSRAVSRDQTWRQLDGRWVVLGIASFSAALALRAALPFSLGNWYSEVLPAFGPPPWMRFGPGSFAFQSLLRDGGMWGPRALAVSQLLIGAAALPLLLGVLWELHIGLEATAATLVLFVFAPFHARLSASASEHVLASTLCLGLLLAWLRAVHTGDWAWLALAALLFPAVCATRVDMTVQASLVLLWPLVRDRVERERGSRGWSLSAPFQNYGDLSAWCNLPRPLLGKEGRLAGIPPPYQGGGQGEVGSAETSSYLRTRILRWRAAIVLLVAALTVAAVYRFIALPSHHPLPDPAGRIFALRTFIPQYWLLATGDPAWVSLPAVLLAIVGVVGMAVRRPLLLVRVAATLAVAFVALGRTFLPDELLGARYFLFTIPIFLIASGQGFQTLLARVPRRPRPVVAAVGVVLLGLWSGLAAHSAYGVRYAFQDEYTFLRSALNRLPAGCTVYAVPMRADVFPHDLDCCLDLRRSPLVLDYPQLQFQDLPDAVNTVFESPGCVAYYESVACAIRDDPNDPSVHDRADKAADYLQQRCAGVRKLGRLEPLGEVTISPRATINFFHGKRPRAGLYRWMPAQG